jgi:hypothetical protein
VVEISPEWVTGPEQGKSSDRVATFSLWTCFFTQIYTFYDYIKYILMFCIVYEIKRIGTLSDVIFALFFKSCDNKITAVKIRTAANANYEAIFSSVSEAENMTSTILCTASSALIISN